MSRPRDLAFEALAEATSTDWEQGRGELNKALASIREQFEGDDLALSMEISERARLYRKIFVGAALTPTALAKHWLRVYEEAHRQREEQATNQSAPYQHCATCAGHGFVVYSMRQFPETHWMKEQRAKGHRLHSDKQRGFRSTGEIEEYAPCYICGGGVNTSFTRFDGTRFFSPDPARVAEMHRR